MDNKEHCLACLKEKGLQQTCPHCGYGQGSGPESLLHLPPGTELQGKYVIGRALGQGGFGITYLAWDKNLKIKLAIKEYLPQQLATRRAGQNEVSVVKSSLSGEFKYGLQKFLEEARTLARFIEHPNVVSVRDYFEANNTAYLVMNYHEGVTLQQYLQARGGKIAFEQALDIFMPVLDALKEVHAAGILHRDISPDNLLVNTRGQVVLIDFGAARQAMGEKSGSLSVIMKAGYSPLEQYQSKGRQGPWTDIYAVAATIYRSLTGFTPPEPFDRFEEDPLKPLSTYGIEIEAQKEEALLKALALRVEERYQTGQEFQEDLTGSTESADAGGYAGAEVTKTAPGAEETGQALKVTNYGELDGSYEEKPGKRKLFSMESKKTGRFVAVAIAAGLFLFGSLSLLSGEREESYYLVYGEPGTIALAELEIGAKVVDLSWEWEFKGGENYTGSGEKEPVTWIVVAKNHYEGLDPHVTLLSEELIGRHVFDNSTDRESSRGSNHWGRSGTTDADRGLRPWLNSTGIHQGDGFFEAFSDDFKNIVLTTSVPNRDWEDGGSYVSDDMVFIPSATELGDPDHERTYEIGTAYPFFENAANAARVARLYGEDWWYWTRSPVSAHIILLRSVSPAGGFSHGGVSVGSDGVRPVLNVCALAMVSEYVD